MPGGATRVQQAFLVSMQDTADYDSLARFYCRSAGGLTVKVRGIRKQTSRLGPKLKQADELEISLSGRGKTPILSGISTSHDNTAWRTDINSLALVWFMLDCAWIASADDETNQQVFRLIANIMRAGHPGSRLNTALSTFCLKFLKIQGLQPDIEYCSVDGHKLAELEPVHLIPGCEGLAGREGYNKRYGSAGLATVPFQPADIAAWRQICAASLAGCLTLDCTPDCAALALLSAVSLLEQACGRRPGTAEFLGQQWKLPDFSELNRP